MNVLSWILNSNEKLEHIGKGVYIIVSDEHTFNTDTFLLANFVNSHKNDSIVELGTGCGAIPFILSVKNRFSHITAVEIQESAYKMFLKSIKYNNLENTITAIHSDMNNLSGKIELDKHDIVICNPPYKSMGTGILNSNAYKTIARHEQKCKIENITNVAFKLLKFGGKLYMCNRMERLCDVISAMRASRVEPKKLQFVQQRNGKAPKLFLIEGKKGGKQGLVALPTFFIEDDNMNYSKEMKKIYDIYGDYEK